MKTLVLVLALTSLTACSSLITRGELNSCNSKCGSKIEKLSKSDGKISCECKKESVSKVDNTDFTPCAY